MKKAISLLLAALMVFTLFACGAKTDGNPPANESPAAESPADTAPAAPADTPEEPEAPAGEDDLTYIMDKGTLVIGITPYEPMNYEDENGTLVGFDTEFAEALCAKLGVTPDFKWINWDSKEIELKARNIDCIWNGLTVTEERRENMAFTTSYLQNEQVVVVRAADAEKYTDIASLQDAAIVAEQESAGAKAIETDMPDALYTPVDYQATALLEVKAGTADAAVVDYTLARSTTGEGTDYADLVIVSSIKLSAEEFAIGLRLDSPAVDSFNAIIAELYADGTLSALADKYEIPDLLIRS